MSKQISKTSAGVCKYVSLDSSLISPHSSCSYWIFVFSLMRSPNLWNLKNFYSYFDELAA